MSYRVDVSPAAVRALRRLPASHREPISRAIAALTDEPRPDGVKKLRGVSHWRIRVGEYRVIYSVSDRERWVAVHQVERRTTTTYD